MTSEIPFPDIVDFQEGPGIMARDFREAGIPLLRLAGLSSHSLLTGCNYLDPEMVEKKWGHFRLRLGDTLLSTSASLGRVGRVGDEAVGAIPYTGIIRMRPRNARVVPEFIQYLILGEHFQRQIEAMGSGSVMRHFGPTHLRTMTVLLPSMRQQEAICVILIALDDKIDSNRRLAEVLEESSATLFRAQFVDFVGIEEFQDTGLARVPRGWRVGSLVDLARFVNGRAFTKDATGVGRPIIRIRELNNGIDASTPRGELDATDDHLAHEDDILFAWSGSLAAYHWPGPEALINQHIFKVIPQGWPPWYVFRWIEEHMTDFRAIAQDKATTMGHIQRRHLGEASVVLPDADAIAEAERRIGPLDGMRAALVAESRTLAEIRDKLLPKLVSGQIRVPDTSDPAEVIEQAAETLSAGSQ